MRALAALLVVGAAVALAVWPAPTPPAPAPAPAAPETTAVSTPVAAVPLLPTRPLDTAGLVHGLQPVAESEVIGRPPGASELGFVPEEAVVDPADAPPADAATLDLLDPEELAFKRAAGDLDAPLDEEALLKAEAQTGDVLGGGATADTALGDVAPLAPSELEPHVDGHVGLPDRTSEGERHHGGARPVPTPRSPTEGDALAEVDVTTEEVLVPPPATDGPLYADTRTPTAPVPVWEGPGTDTTAGP